MPTPDRSKEEDSPEEASPEEGLIESFLSTYDRLQTRKSYGHDLRDFFGEGAVTAEGLAAREDEAAGFLRETAREKGKSAARRRASALRSFYRWANEEGLVSKEQANKVIEAARPSEWDPEENAPKEDASEEVSEEGVSEEGVSEEGGSRQGRP